MGSGLFDLKNGEKRPYYNMYAFSPVSDYVSGEYEAAAIRRRKRSSLFPTFETA